MDYKTALGYYRSNNLSIDKIQDLLQIHDLNHNERLALETIYSEMINDAKRDYQSEAAEPAADERINQPEYSVYKSSDIDINDIYRTLNRTSDNIHTIKNILLFYLILSIIGIVFYIVAIVAGNLL